VILQSAPPAFLEDITARAKVVSSSTMYPEHGVENALDGNPNNNYVAAVEGPLPQQFELEFNSVVDLRELMLVWESAENYATSYDIEAIEPGEGGEKVRLLAKVEDGKGQAQQQEWSTGENVRRLRVTVRATHGQPRLLLRQIKLLAIPESAHTQGAVDAKSATK